MNNPARIYIDFNDGWRFAPGDHPGAQRPDYSDETWRTLRLPHDWSIETPFDRDSPALGRGGYLTMGIGWYRKRFIAPACWAERDVDLRFGGIYRRSEIWLNGKLIGGRPGGYVEHNYQIGDLLMFGQENVLAVRVDNSLQPGSRAYTGSGINRDVTVLLRGNVQIEGDHPFVTTVSADGTLAKLRIRYGIRALSADAKSYTVKTALLDREGRLCWTGQADGELTAGAGEARLDASVPSPRLWSPEDPYLYRLVTELYADGRLTDTAETPCGIRYMCWTAEDGFHLNGRRVPLKGVCLHQDNGCLGAVENRSAEARKIAIMRQMGCNAIRLSHDPFPESFLTLCDEMGILVVDEIFEEWFTPKRMLALRKDRDKETIPVNYYAAFFKDWYARDLRDTILRDRRHPSIIAYSVGNELIEQRFSDPEAIPYLQDICREIRTLDGTRAVTCACCFDVEGADDSPFYQDLDLVGYNYAEALYDEHLARFPDRKIFGSENTSITPFLKRGVYDLDDLSKLQCTIDLTRGESIDSSKARHLSGEYSMRLHQSNKRIGGMFIWTGMDYLGEPTPYTWPSRSSYFGVTDTCGFPKDAYYFYQSCWSDKPVLHLFPHWNWEGMEGRPIDVLAYTNCDSAELFLNGVSQGICRFDPRQGMHLHWRVPYKPGTLTVRGYDSAGELCAEDRIVTAGPPAEIRLSAEQTVLRDLYELCYITARVVDAAGNPVPVDASRITFTPEDGLEIVGVDNGDPTYTGMLKSDSIPTLGGLCLCVARRGGRTGKFTVTAVSGNLKPGTVTVCCE